jgi:hypothetical protein
MTPLKFETHSPCHCVPIHMKFNTVLRYRLLIIYVNTCVQVCEVAYHISDPFSEFTVRWPGGSDVTTRHTTRTFDVAAMIMMIIIIIITLVYELQRQDKCCETGKSLLQVVQNLFLFVSQTFPRLPTCSQQVSRLFIFT